MVSETTIAVVVSIIGAVGSPLVAFLTSYRLNSGRVTTSEAAALWEEGSELREFLRREIDRVKEEFDAHKNQTMLDIATYRDLNSRLAQQLQEAISDRERLQDEVDSLREILRMHGIAD
jgi:predicted RNase H-like nuclease (RuvC/YqgF family)